MKLCAAWKSYGKMVYSRRAMVSQTRLGLKKRNFPVTNFTHLEQTVNSDKIIK